MYAFNSRYYSFKFLLRGFTKFGRNDYLKFKSEYKIIPDGGNGKVMWTCLTMQYTMMETICHIDFIMLTTFLLVNLHLG